MCKTEYLAIRRTQLARMSQPEVRVTVSPELANKLKEEAEHRWPGHGKVAVDRLVRSLIQNSLKKTNGKSKKWNSPSK